jgi:hypothetical protein
MLPEIDNLREIARRCQAGEPLNSDLSRWLGSSLDDFLNQRSPSLGEAFGLRGAQGGVPWWLEDAIRKRNAALRELAECLRSDDSTTALTREVHRLTLHYAGTSWNRDRCCDEMPRAYAGTHKACLWRAFKSGAAMPVCERQLRSILAH